jgi:hypothetical protein
MGVPATLGERNNVAAAPQSGGKDRPADAKFTVELG